MAGLKRSLDRLERRFTALEASFPALYRVLAEGVTLTERGISSTTGDRGPTCRRAKLQESVS